MALGGSLWEIGDFGYRSLDAKLRFYPNGEALRGFSVAGTAGYTHVRAEDSFICFEDCTTAGDAITLGVDLNYQWLLGRTRSFALTLGGGAKRLFYTGGSTIDASIGIPTVRFSIGYAF